MLKKIVVLLVLLAFFYLIYNLVRQRQKILAMETFQEGAIFSVPSKDNELSSLTADLSSPSGIGNAKTNMPLIQYCIKASYNSAFTGNYINRDMIKYLLSRGVRFFDFEVYPNSDAKDSAGLTPIVSCKDVAPQTTETLTNILKVFGENGFQGVSPNPRDPIFLHFRIYPNKNNYLYSAIASVIEKSNISPRLYRDKEKKTAIQINPAKTRLSDIMGKVIIVLDYSEPVLKDNYKSDVYKCAKLAKPSNPCYDFSDYVNFLSGASNPKYFYSQIIQQKTTPPIINDDGATTSVSRFTLVCPDTCNNFFGMASAPPYYKMPLNYGIQVAMYPFYLNSVNLGGYEEAFANSDASAFVPMSTMISYVKKNGYSTA